MKKWDEEMYFDSEDYDIELEDKERGYTFTEKYKGRGVRIRKKLPYLHHRQPQSGDRFFDEDGNERELCRIDHKPVPEVKRIITDE